MKRGLMILGAFLSSEVLMPGGPKAVSAGNAVQDSISAEEYVVISEVNFPDENFRNYISENIDVVEDGLLTAEEISGVVTIDVSGLGIETLDGIKYFTELQQLFCQDNQLDSIDIHAIPYIREIVEKNLVEVDEEYTTYWEIEGSLAVLKYDTGVELIISETKTGWVFEEDHWYFFDDDGEAVTDWNCISGKWYYFDAEGIMLTGWLEIEGDWYWFSGSGAIGTGWQKVGSRWYFFGDNGKMRTDWQQIKGKWYFFDGNGRMQTGWLKSGTKWYFFDDDGRMQTGWKQIGKIWYYFDANGRMQTGWKEISGKWYYFDSNGRMKTGWMQNGVKWYYFSSDGRMQTGWKTIGGKWYYFNSDGRMQTAWKEIAGKWYYFGTDGVMKTGWLHIGSKWYFFGTGGNMLSENPVKSGWQTQNGLSYQFKADGVIMNTGKEEEIIPNGQYKNWDGVTNVAQFKGADGGVYFAVDKDNSVTFYKAENGKMGAAVVTLKKAHPVFGTAICDKDGYFYLVTGEVNETDDESVDTVFISKYDSKGRYIKTVGDNGSIGYSGNRFCTKGPFESGCCDAAISGDVLTVNYARHMYSGHQSNTTFSVNIKTMTKVKMGAFYNSHSFAQRVVATADGFAYVSEGDCYDRAFTTYSVVLDGDTVQNSAEANIFDFWVEDGAYDAYDMHVLNNNFAHMGGIAALSDGRIAFAAQSARSLSSKAESEEEDIFIQIYDPFKDLGSAAGYTTSGTRSGLAGNNGRDKVTNYGVKWLTSYTGTDYFAENVQIACTDDDKIVVLYELYKSYEYKGVYYIILDAKGNVLAGPTCFDSAAKLNSCEMPVYSDNMVCWMGNRYDDEKDSIFLYMLDVSSALK